MKILAARIKWYHGYGNMPGIEVLVDEDYKFEEMVYEKRNGLYLATKGCFASFFSYSSPGNGFGGSRFLLNMKDGSQEELIGPWSSNSSAINAEFGCQVMEVSYTDNPIAYERGYTFTAGAMMIDAVKEAMDLVVEPQPVELIHKYGFTTFGIHSCHFEESLPEGYYKPSAPSPHTGKILPPQLVVDMIHDDSKEIVSDLSSQQVEVLLK